MSYQSQSGTFVISFRFVVAAGGRPISALVLDVADGLVRTVHLVANPEKLAGVRGIETP